METQQLNNKEDDDDSSVSSPSISGSSFSSATSETCITRCCDIPASPYPVYLVATLFFISAYVSDTTFNSVLYNKLCYERYGLIDECNNSTFTSTHPDLQVEQATWSNYVSLLSLPFSIFTNLLLSSYCDKVGHKFPLTLPVAGTMLSCIYVALLSTPQFLSWPMTTILVYPILNTILGGSPLVVVASFSYVALVTPVEKRTMHMLLAEGTMGIGALVGSLFYGPVFDVLGLDKLAYITAAISVLPVLVALFFVQDTISSSRAVTWREVINFKGLSDAFRTIYKKRNGYLRLLLILSFLLYFFPYMASTSFNSVKYLFLVKQSGLTMSQYSTFVGVAVALQTFGGTGIIIVFKKILRIEDFLFSIGCAVSMAIGYIIMSQPSIPQSIWVGAALLTPQGVLLAIIRTVQTKICDKDELGKLFAFDAIIQSLLTTGVTIGAKAIYTASLSVWPGLFLALNAFLILCSMIVCAIMSQYNNAHTHMMAALP